MVSDSIMPIVDLFAGPGGLSEGFSAFRTDEGHFPFKIALSIEKDVYAHQTLTVRSFYRQFSPENTPQDYYDYLRGIEEPEPERRKKLFSKWRNEAELAQKTAILAELGATDTQTIRQKIKAALAGYDDFILLGGPPCQAYSVIGRSRNTGNPAYKPEKDTRQRLYVEYLQVLADHHPCMFVMENVKGLLSATVQNQRVFERILKDLHSPCEAILREGRQLADGRRRTRYNLFAISRKVNGDAGDMRRFIVRMEKHGVPQARHRLIIFGVRSDLCLKDFPPLKETEPTSVNDVLADLPPVRSGLSREKDGLVKWRERLGEIRNYSFMTGLRGRTPDEIKDRVENALHSIGEEALCRGGEFVYCEPNTLYKKEWYLDPRLKGVCNHTTRLHIASDLHRYLYAAGYAQVQKRSPDLRDFPEELLPKHRNARQSADNGAFDDRFHVQLLDHPSTTVTSHLAKDGHYFIHPDPAQCRSMTVREVARLQTFPDNYFFCGPRTAQYTQVGNAVPPLLANQIAVSTFETLSKCGLIE